jgi:hypothetical protein
MGRIVSIHEYDLKPGINVEQFEQVLRDAEARGLLQLPGLVAHHFVKGAKASAAAPTPPYGSTRVARLGNTSGAPLNIRGPLRSIPILGRSGRTNFSLPF